MGGDQYLEQPNLERLTLRDFEISNIKRMKDKFFDFFIFVFIFHFYICLNYSNTQNMIIYKLGNLWNFEFFEILEFQNFDDF